MGLSYMNLNNFPIATSDEFKNWKTINDTIMGGSSQAICKSGSNGLCLEGNLIEENGGFISCRSPLISPGIDLSSYEGIQIDVDGQGRTLKFAVTCGDTLTRFSKTFSGGLKWVAQVPTKVIGTSFVRIPFDEFEPSIRAKPIMLPAKIGSNSIVQFQLLYSKFGISGKLNSEFRSGPFSILLRSISAF